MTSAGAQFLLGGLVTLQNEPQPGEVERRLPAML
jgi:hypothetical protein